MAGYSDCTLCPRACHVDRTIGQLGVCGMSDRMAAARAALHYWEEPCISGVHGSGAVFFSGCPLHCVYCQNAPIARGDIACEISCERLVEIYFELREKGANNINLVSASQFLPDVIFSIEKAREQGFDLPFVYNSGGYESVKSLERLEGLIDIYLPDYKYVHSCDSARYSHCPDYPDVAIAAIDEMVRQRSECVFDKEGIMTSGVIIRHLILPGKVIESKQALKRIHQRYGDKVYISIMSQYTPLEWVKDYPEIDRTVTENEYRSLVEYALECGITKAYTQSGEAVGESFIPEFNYEGLK